MRDAKSVSEANLKVSLEMSWKINLAFTCSEIKLDLNRFHSTFSGLFSPTVDDTKLVLVLVLMAGTLDFALSWRIEPRELVKSNTIYVFLYSAGRTLHHGC